MKRNKIALKNIYSLCEKRKKNMLFAQIVQTFKSIFRICRNFKYTKIHMLMSNDQNRTIYLNALPCYVFKLRFKKFKKK